MFYNIKITLDNGILGFLGIYNGRFMTHAPNRNCVVWMKSLKVAQRVVKRINKMWPNFTKVEIKKYDRILL